MPESAESDDWLGRPDEPIPPPPTSGDTVSISRGESAPSEGLSTAIFTGSNTELYRTITGARFVDARQTEAERIVEEAVERARDEMLLHGRQVGHSRHTEHTMEEMAQGREQADALRRHRITVEPLHGIDYADCRTLGSMTHYDSEPMPEPEPSPVAEQSGHRERESLPDAAN